MAFLLDEEFSSQEDSNEDKSLAEENKETYIPRSLALTIPGMEAEDNSAETRSNSIIAGSYASHLARTFKEGILAKMPSDPEDEDRDRLSKSLPTGFGIGKEN